MSSKSASSADDTVARSSGGLSGPLAGGRRATAPSDRPECALPAPVGVMDVVGGEVVGVELADDASSPRRARALVQQVCQRAGLSAAVVQRATVLTSELVTNAVRYGSGDPRLVVEASTAGARVEVADESPVLPPVHPGLRPPITDDGGRGLWILDAWADGWGASARGRGKVVWFELNA